MTSERPVRWGIVGTANIARASFLPGLRYAGGTAAVVGSRDPEAARAWAADKGVERAATYAEAVSADDVDVVYVALPNHLHAEWTIAALRAGKAVLCEKPLCTSVPETEQVLQVARETGMPLWEAFVFPFQRQFERLERLVHDRAIGDVREIQSSFYFQLRNRQNIRLSMEMAGGALNDVGCYCLHLALLLFREQAEAGVAMATWAHEGVDEETQGVVAFPGGKHLTFGCGMLRPYDTLTRVLGDNGEIRLSNPFHPGGDDTLELRVPSGVTTEHLVDREPSFGPALEHIQAVVRGTEQPRHLAIHDSLPVARALAMLHEQMGG